MVLWNYIIQNNLNHFQLFCYQQWLQYYRYRCWYIKVLIQSQIKHPSISTLEELVNVLVTEVKLENIITVPNEIHIGDIFEVNATVVNTLPFNVTIIAGNCNSDFSTNFYNNIEEIITSQCMNRILPTILEQVVEQGHNIKQ